LEDLKFTRNNIFKCKLETIDSYINWPQTLKKLTIGRNLEIFLEDDHDLIPIHPLEGCIDVPSTKFLLLPSHLGNLESLSFNSVQYERDENFDDMLDFLKVNPHITKLSFPLETTPQLFDIISSFQNLEHLDIFSNYPKGHEIIDNIKTSIPSNLKSVSLGLDTYKEVINFLNKPFLQITCLTVKFEFIEFHYICLLISKLPAMQLLKNLKFCFESISCISEDATDSFVDKSFGANCVRFPSLERVKFRFEQIIINSNIAKIILNKLMPRVDECPKLNYIEFKSKNNLKHIGEIESEKLGSDDGWKLISTPCRFLLHKAN
jgi:hypothetical protein